MNGKQAISVQDLIWAIDSQDSSFLKRHFVYMLYIYQQWLKERTLLIGSFRIDSYHTLYFGF